MNSSNGNYDNITVFAEETQSQLDEQVEYLEDYSSDIMASNVTIHPASVLIARNRFCRLCLKKSDSFLLPLVAKMEQVSVMEMLVDVTGVELEANPLYPTKVCTNCMTKLDFAHSVRQEFLSSSELLLKMAVEGRLPAYYAQYEDESSLKNINTYSDEILYASKSILETRTNLNTNVYAVEEKPMVEEVIEEENDQDDRETEEETEAHITEQEEILTEDPPVDQTEIPASETNESIPEKKVEKFVYSWKELVKPKKKKKEKPKKLWLNFEGSMLTGINRRGKADADLLSQFPQTTCYICDTPHETLEQRDEHLNTHIALVPHKCETCSTEKEPVISKSVLTLNRHRLMHKLPHKCEFCFRRFISSGSQYTHVWSMHMGDTEGLTCDYCGKSFTQKRSFQAHVRRHRYKANGKFKCEVCGETCGSSLLLTRHQRMHTGEKNFSCPYCSKSFSRACNLLTHKRIHTNERCHKCPDCAKKFRDSVTLRKHQERFHMGKAPTLKIDRNPYVITEDGRKLFKCKYENCSYATHSSTSISRHKARHVKRYACADCGKRFAEPNLVRKHQAALHSGKGQKRGSNKGTFPVKMAEQAIDQQIDIVEEEEYISEEYEQTLKTEPEYEVEIVDDVEVTVEVI